MTMAEINESVLFKEDIFYLTKPVYKNWQFLIAKHLRIDGSFIIIVRIQLIALSYMQLYIFLQSIFSLTETNILMHAYQIL
jgi:hypothetical protein